MPTITARPPSAAVAGQEHGSPTATLRAELASDGRRTVLTLSRPDRVCRCSTRARRPRGAWRVATLAMLLAVALAIAVAPGAARADGDPGSDVLVYQPLFLASDAGVPIAEQVRLGELLRGAARAGFPIRVAIIAHRADLGAIGALWGRPQAYARFLGTELSLAYKGRLLIVMPDGLGFAWPGHSPAAAAATLDRIRTGPGGAALADAARSAVTALATGAHARLAPAAAGGASSSSGAPADGASSRGSPGPAGTGSSGVSPTHTGSTRALAFAVLIGLALAIAAVRLMVARRRRGPGAERRRTPRPGAARTRRAIGAVRAIRVPRMAWVAGLALVAIVVAMYALRPQGTASAPVLANNPVLDSGTTLDRPAPDFTLTDQFGHSRSLRSFRGRVVILAFNDSECTTLCPLTTTAMLDAKAMLGPAARRVQLLGVDANPAATSIGDVLSYSQLHGMLHAWDFLTGGLGQLRRVWHDYSIGTQITRRVVDHTPAIFVIDTHGRLAKLYLTQQSYSAVGQLGQLLATRAASLLPGRPHVDSHLSYARIPGIAPTTATTLARPGGGRLALGPGRSRLLVFFATWDRQLTGLTGGLESLNRYQRLAVRRRLPRLVAVDEGAVEPPGALAPFLHGLPTALRFPVAIDGSGRVADGYEVQGQPWLELVNRAGHIAWYSSIAGNRWPSPQALARTVRIALSRASAATTRAASPRPAPPALAALHRQASQIIGGSAGLTARIAGLRGHPIVLNVWASWCTPCRQEFGRLAVASARYGNRVAFLGADNEDSASDARAFLGQHHVDYPSYATTSAQLSRLAVIEGLPTTIYIDSAGRVTDVHTGPYDAQGTLDQDIAARALSVARP